ncbi:MAG: hypothetical protein HC848_07535 [Limnobacter sp.]|nr:hypothetical protein [Limnobacter sp.]
MVCKSLRRFFQAYFASQDEALEANYLADCAAAADGSLNVSSMLALEHTLQLEVLRSWLQHAGVRCGQAKLLELARQLALPQGGKRQVAAGWWVQVQRGVARVCVAE